MNEKKIFQRFIGCIAFCFCTGALIVAGLVWVVDPFYQYHSPWLGMPVILDDAVYQTAGAARNLEYDSAIVGTSMTENFHTSWFDDELGWNTMKLSYSGARTNDLQAIFQEINEHEGDIQHIFMDINDYQLTSIAWTAYVTRPDYLYDENLLNDYKYLFNQDVLTLSVERTVSALKGTENNIDTAYTWEDPELFGEEITLETCRALRNDLIAGQEANGLVPYEVPGTLTTEINDKYTICQENLDNITPFIEEHPDTTFHIIIPPYSMLYWEQKVLAGTLEDTIAIYYYALEQLLEYDNVKIYYFQNETDIITNLENYRDNCHHAPEYNRYMFDCMKNGENLLTPENCKEQLTEMYFFAKDYPYETLWQ